MWWVSWSRIYYRTTTNYYTTTTPPLGLIRSLISWMIILIDLLFPGPETSRGYKCRPRGCVMHHQETVNCKYLVSIIALSPALLLHWELPALLLSMEWNISATKLNIQPARPGRAMMSRTNKPFTDNLGLCREICKYLNKRKIIKTNILKFRIFRCDPKYLHTMYIITSYMDLRN